MQTKTKRPLVALCHNGGDSGSLQSRYMVASSMHGWHGPVRSHCISTGDESWNADGKAGQCRSIFGRERLSSVAYHFRLRGTTRSKQAIRLYRIDDGCIFTILTVSSCTTVFVAWRLPRDGGVPPISRVRRITSPPGICTGFRAKTTPTATAV